MRRALTDTLVSAAALLVVLIGLAAIDERVRERVVSAVREADLSSSVSSIANVGGDVAGIMLLAARDQSVDHAPMAVFVVSATILVLAMLRL
jgi:hypothetical protein